MKPNLTNPAKKAPTRRTKTTASLSTSAPSRTSRVGKVAQIAPLADPDPVTTNSPRPVSKKGAIEALVRRPRGTALAELMTATGWQEHSVRAALTGLRKAGHTIIRDRNDGVTRYRIEGVA